MIYQVSLYRLLLSDIDERMIDCVTLTLFHTSQSGTCYITHPGIYFLLLSGVPFFSLLFVTTNFRITNNAAARSTVACRGGAKGAMAPGIPFRGASKLNQKANAKRNPFGLAGG